MRRFRLALLVAALAVGVFAGSALSTAASASSQALLVFDSMAPVTGPYVGSANPVRGLSGGGLPWMIGHANGVLSADGHLVVQVRGLVLADAAPVPANLRGTNPIPDFRAVVSCQTISGTAATVANVATTPFPASSQGDATVVTNVSLPSPCIAPIVFVTSPGEAWFAAIGG
jgi:hypothetical protein